MAAERPAPSPTDRPGQASAAGASEAIIRLQGVTRRFGAFTAVDDVTLDVRPGEVFGLIGHNGAGKSTLFKIMLGLLAPTSGSIHIAGEPVGQASALQVRRRIGYLPENVALWDNLSGLETRKFFARLKGLDTAGCAALLTKVGLEHAGDRPVRAYSKGMRQRLGFAQALQGNPQVLFLDEPTTGLDPQARRNLWELIESIRDEGITIVLTTHYMDEAELLCDRLAIMDEGKIITIDTPKNLVKQLLDRGFKKKQTVEQANLEDVFIDLTGKAIRE